MSDGAFRSFAESKGFHAQTISRWQNWQTADRAALSELVLDLKISENHLRDIMDWSEEIALRDGVSVASILAGKAIGDIATDPRLGRADQVKRIKESLRRLRFPRLARVEDEIQAKIRALKLQPEIRLTVSPGLEGGRLQIELSATNQQDLRRLADKLAAAAMSSLTAELFALLGGTAGGREPA